jgi:hypothetical protein
LKAIQSGGVAYYVRRVLGRKLLDMNHQVVEARVVCIDAIEVVRPGLSIASDVS